MRKTTSTGVHQKVEKTDRQLVTSKKFATSKLTYSTPEDPLLKKIFIRSIERLTGRPSLERKYNMVLSANPEPDEIWSILVQQLEVELNYSSDQLNKIPTSGPIVFIANHPFGVVDGIILGYLVSLVHPSFKFLVNEVLCREEVLNNFFLPVDFAPTKAAQRTNLRTREIAIERLASDEPIVIFPSGGVATSPRLGKKAEELEWKRFVIKLIQKSEATVVPIYFEGQNSFLFQLASLISMDLRLAFLLNEVRNKIGKQIEVKIGDPIAYKFMQPFERTALLKFLQNSVESLAEK